MTPRDEGRLAGEKSTKRRMLIGLSMLASALVAFSAASTRFRSDYQ